MTPIREGDTVLVGDSITQTAEWYEFFPSQSALRNRGINGDTTAGVLARVPAYCTAVPGKIFLLVGINDLNNGHTVQEASENYRGILSTIRSASPRTKCYAQAVMPCREIPGRLATRQLIQSFNNEIARQAHDAGATFIDTYSPFVDADGEVVSRYFLPDGLHLSADGYRKYVDVLRPYVATP